MCIRDRYTTGNPTLPNYMTLLSQQSYKTVNGQSSLKLYKYNQTLPLGFMMNLNTEASWKKNTGDVYKRQVLLWLNVFFQYCISTS